MEKLGQTSAPEPELAASGSGVLRRSVYGLLALMLVGGAWVRFDDRIAQLSPSLAAPAAPAAQHAADAGGIQALLELGLVPATGTEAAVATMQLPGGEATSLTADLQRHRLRLVQLPLFDGGAPLADGTAARMVQVSSGGYSRLVALSRHPVLVTLPIDRVGTVSFQVASADPGVGSDTVGIGALTVGGPVRLPDLARGQEIDVGVVAQ